MIFLFVFFTLILQQKSDEKSNFRCLFLARLERPYQYVGETYISTQVLCILVRRGVIQLFSLLLYIYYIIYLCNNQNLKGREIWLEIRPSNSLPRGAPCHDIGYNEFVWSPIKYVTAGTWCRWRSLSRLRGYICTYGVWGGRVMAGVMPGRVIGWVELGNTGYYMYVLGTAGLGWDVWAGSCTQVTGSCRYNSTYICTYICTYDVHVTVIKPGEVRGRRRNNKQLYMYLYMYILYYLFMYLFMYLYTAS